MPSVPTRLLSTLLITVLVGCTSSPKREPQAVESQHDPRKVRLLRLAAESGVLFQISDSVIRDVPMKSAGDRCRKSDEGPWAEQVFRILNVFEAQPSLLSKINVIEFRRGNIAGAEISRDLDGATTLVISYSKFENRERIEALADIPCGDGDMSLLGKDLTVTDFEWPTPATVASVLMNAPERQKVERFDLDRRFLVWLANRATLLRLTPELAFEKSPTGEPLLAIILSQLSNEIATSPHQGAVDYWLKEISERSRLGASIKFFGITRDIQLSTGLHVDSAGKFARRLNGYADPTYPFVSYRLENGAYSVSGLGNLNHCLSELMSTYRSPLSSMSSYDMDRDSFMFPGHSCQTAGAD